MKSDSEIVKGCVDILKEAGFKKANKASIELTLKYLISNLREERRRNEILTGRNKEVHL